MVALYCSFLAISPWIIKPVVTTATSFSPRYGYHQWGQVLPTIPTVAAGVYAAWERDRLIYVGMSGRQLEHNVHKTRYGLVTRLESHWSGRLSGDQFCVYVANRLVIPDLLVDQLSAFRDGRVTLDVLTRTYIRERVDFQHVVVASSAEAHELEMRGRSGALFGCVPQLNPLPA
jgi:hypothetical protein